MGGFVEFEDYDALGLGELVRGGEVHPRELVEAAIERIEARNPALNAVIQRDYDRARARAAGPVPGGPFAGVPYLVKDAIAYAGLPLTFGTEFLRRAGHRPAETHEVLRRSEGAGLIVLGQTNICELGLLPTTEPAAYGPTCNPWDLSRSPGGSSGGSAAAVAGGMVPMAHGNDGGGSIRIPASACGLFGFKPSRGRNPEGEFDPPDGMLTEHCLSRSVRDSAALLDVTRGTLPGARWWAPPPERPYLEEVGREPGPLRIAWAATDLLGQPVHPDCAAAARDAAALCASLGHHVEEARPDIDGEAYNAAFLVLWSAFPTYLFKAILKDARQQGWIDLAVRLAGERLTLAALTRLGTARLRPFEPLTMELAAIGRRMSHGDLWLAWSDLQAASYAMGRLLARYDLFLTPVLAEPPLPTGALDPPLERDAVKARIMAYVAYTHVCNISGLPAMSVPLFWNDAGLPIGVNFAGRFGHEHTLFRLAGQLEQARPWSARRPPPVAGC